MMITCSQTIDRYHAEGSPSAGLPAHYLICAHGRFTFHSMTVGASVCHHLVEHQQVPVTKRLLTSLPTNIRRWAARDNLATDSASNSW